MEPDSNVVCARPLHYTFGIKFSDWRWLEFCVRGSKTEALMMSHAIGDRTREQKNEKEKKRTEEWKIEKKWSKEIEKNRKNEGLIEKKEWQVGQQKEFEMLR